MGNGTVSIRLTDGTVVSSTFQDNGDGRVGMEDNGEAERALTSLRAKLESSGYHGSFINPDSKVIVVESGHTGESGHRVDVSAGSLLRGGTVRLFTSPDVVLSDRSWVHAEMWRPSGNTNINGTSYTIWREADRWEDGHSIRGRTVAVPRGFNPAVENSWRGVLVDENTLPGATPTTTPGALGPTPQWASLGTVFDRNNGNMPAYGGQIPTDGLSYVANAAPIIALPPAGTALNWRPDPRGPQPDGFMYFQAPGGAVARRSIANPSESYVMLNSGPHGITDATWRGADEADGVPPNPARITVGRGRDAHEYLLVPGTPPTSGGFDLFTGIRMGSNPPATLAFHRRHGDANAPLEVQQGTGRGATWVNPSDYHPNRPAVPSHARARRHRASHHAGPRIFRN